VLPSGSDGKDKKHWRPFFGGRTDLRCRGERSGRGIAWQQVKENLRADPNADSAEAHEEKDNCGEIADADTEAERNAREIAIAEKEENVRDADAFRDARADGHCVSEEKEIFGEPLA
jgi:hypothetical protein